MWKMRKVLIVRYLIYLFILTLLYTPQPLHASPASQSVDAEISEQISTLTASEPAVSEPFRTNEGSWNLTASDDVRRFFQTSTLRIHVTAEQTVGWSQSNWTIDDFYLEVDTFHVDGPLDNEFGVIFRYIDAQNFYLFAGSHDGYYTLQKMVDGEWDDLIAWTPSGAIQVGADAQNQLALLVEENHFTLLINGDQVATVEDNTFERGYIALAAGSFDEGDVIIAFDDFTLWAIGDLQIDEPIAEAPLSSPTSLDEAAILAQLAEIRAEPAQVSDDFRRDNNDWTTTIDQNVEYSYLNRTYQIEVKRANWLAFAFHDELEQQILPNFYSEVEVVHRSATGAIEAGLVFHYEDEENYYLYAISGDGQYRLWRMIKGDWQELLDWTESEELSVGSGARNRLGLMVLGDQITLLINDQPVEQVYSSTSIHGSVGVMAGSFDDAGVTAAFDNFAFWPLEASVATETPTTFTVLEPDPEAVAERLTEIRAAEPTTTDDFRRDTGLWQKPEYDDVTFYYRGGAYRIAVDAANITPGSTSDLTATDFLVEVDASQVAGPDGQYGIFFRQADEDNFYLFAVSPMGSYTVWKRVDGKWTELIPWTENEAIHSGQQVVNRLGILAEATQFTLLVNDTAVMQFVDPDFAHGAIALAAGTFEEPGAEVAFDNLALWVLD